MSFLSSIKITCIIIFVAVCSIGIVHTESNATKAAKDAGNGTRQDSNSFSATIYTESNFWGIWWTLTVANCTDVPGYLYKKTSSIDTHDNCMILFSRQECRGRHVKIAPGTDGHSHLSEVNFDNTLASLKPCRGGSGTLKRTKRTRRNIEALSTLLETLQETSEQPDGDAESNDYDNDNVVRNQDSTVPSILSNLNIADFLNQGSEDNNSDSNNIKLPVPQENGNTGKVEDCG